MFLKNKYTRIYWEIIESAQNRVLTGYTERHHIIPKSMGGGDNPVNLVELTAREHYLVHLLLTKMTVGLDRRNMAYALSYFNTQCKNTRRRPPNSRWYEYSRRLLSDVKRGVAPTKQCQAAAAESRRGQPISADQKAKISAALCKKIAFFAISPNDESHSGDDLKEFCRAFNLSYNTIKGEITHVPRVITSGRRRGWIFCTVPVDLEHAKQFRESELSRAKLNRSKAVSTQWSQSRKEAAAARASKPVILIDPSGVERHYPSLSDVASDGPVSSIQLAEPGHVFKTGAWAGWRKVK